MVRAVCRQAGVEAVGFILPVEKLPPGLIVAVLESLQAVTAAGQGVFAWGLGNSLAHPPHFHSSKGLSRNPGVGLRLLPSAPSPGGTSALDPSWEQSRPGDKAGVQAQVPRTVYHQDGRLL